MLQIFAYVLLSISSIGIFYIAIKIRNEGKWMVAEVSRLRSKVHSQGKTINALQDALENHNDAFTALCEGIETDEEDFGRVKENLRDANLTFDLLYEYAEKHMDVVMDGKTLKGVTVEHI